MSWRQRADLGTQVVGYVHDCMQVDEDWAVDIERGFIWWAEEFAQTIWAEHGIFLHETAMYRLHAETDLLQGRGRAHAFELALMTEMGDATLSACVYDKEKDQYKLHCSVYLTKENFEWMSRLFLAASMLQLSEAHDIGHVLARQLQAVPAGSAHPHHGVRNGRHPMANAIAEIFKPQGQEPSKWASVPEWKETDYAMERQSTSCTSNHHSDLASQLFWGIPDSTGAVPFTSLEVSAEEVHPVLANGLMLRLKLPLQMTPERCAHTALALNQMERDEWLKCHFLGSWCFDDEAIEFECFVPNCAYSPEILMGLALNMTIRSQWASQTFRGWYFQAHPEKRDG